jgi:hypothetical protein
MSCDSRDRIAVLGHEGKAIIYTKRSHGRGKLSDRIAQLIRQQMKRNEDQFRQLLIVSAGP